MLCIQSKESSEIVVHYKKKYCENLKRGRGVRERQRLETCTISEEEVLARAMVLSQFPFTWLSPCPPPKRQGEPNAPP